MEKLWNASQPLSYLYRGTIAPPLRLHRSSIMPLRLHWIVLIVVLVPQSRRPVKHESPLSLLPQSSTNPRWAFHPYTRTRVTRSCMIPVKGWAFCPMLLRDHYFVLLLMFCVAVSVDFVLSPSPFVYGVNVFVLLLRSVLFCICLWVNLGLTGGFLTRNVLC